MIQTRKVVLQESTISMGSFITQKSRGFSLPKRQPSWKQLNMSPISKSIWNLVSVARILLRDSSRHPDRGVEDGRGQTEQEEVLVLDRDQGEGELDLQNMIRTFRTYPNPSMEPGGRGRIPRKTSSRRRPGGRSRWGWRWCRAGAARSLGSSGCQGGQGYKCWSWLWSMQIEGKRRTFPPQMSWRRFSRERRAWL